MFKTSINTIYGTTTLLFRYCVSETVFWRGCIERACQLGYGSDNSLRIRGSVKWMLCHSNRVCNHQFSGSVWWAFFAKRVWMYRFSMLTSVWNCACLQCCATLSCTATPLPYYNLCCVVENCQLNGKTILVLCNIFCVRLFSYKKDIVKCAWNVSSKNRLFSELYLAADHDNANLILIWPHPHFNQKNVKVPPSQKYQC